MKYRLLVLMTFMSVLSLAQEKKYDIDFSGYIVAEGAWDTRKMISGREEQLLLFPSQVKNDASGTDINEVSGFLLSAMAVRMRTKIKAPDVLGAKTTGYIEWDFAGTRKGLENMVRLRHSYVKLSWDKVELLAGQSWNPMFAVECYPQTTERGAALVFNPLARNPQFRVTYKPVDQFSISLTALGHTVFRSTGPLVEQVNTGAGEKSNRFLRDGGLPEFQAQLITGGKGPFIFGLTGGFKRLAPRVENNYGQKVEEYISSLNFSAFTRINLNKATIRLHGIYGENMSHLVMLGGYAIAKEGTVMESDSEVDQRKYANLPTGSLWGDFNYKFGKFSAGIFVGITKRFEASEEIMFLPVDGDDSNTQVAGAYGLGLNIDNMQRVAPRVSYQQGRLKVAVEATYFSAVYGQPDENYGMTINQERATGMRYQLTTLLLF